MNMSSFIINNQWLIYVAAFGSIACNLTLSWSERLARTVPTNYMILALFTLCQSYMVAVICYFTDPEIVIMALVATVGIVASLTLYAM